VVKGSVSAAPITQKLLKQSNKASALRSAPSMSINRQPSSHSTVSGTKQTSSNVHAQPPTPKPKEVMPREPGKVNVTYAGNLATPDDFMASVRRKQAPLAKTQSVTQPKLEPSSHNDAVTMEEPQGSDLQRKQAPAVETQLKPQGDTPKPFARIEGFLETGPNVAKAKTVKAEKPPGQPDLMDFEPVIGFTHPSDSVTKTEKVLQERVTPTDTTSLQSPTSDDMMLLIQKLKIAEAVGAQGEHQEALQNLIHDLEAPVKAKRAQAATAPMKLTKTSTYSVTDMMALRPKIALPPPKDAVTSSKPLAGRGETTVPASIAAMSPISESSSIHNRAPPRPRPAQGRASMSIPNITTLTTDLGLAREIALQQGANRELLVGEHVHKTHFQRAQLVEKREDVSLADSVPSKLAASRAGPSLPAHLANLAAITDHGAATRSQYDALSDTSSHTSRRGPSLPAHLANQPAVTDAGAAVRAEYDSGPVTSRGRGVLSDYNGQLRSSTLTNSAPAPPTGPKSRSSMLSKTGFIGRAEN